MGLLHFSHCEREFKNAIVIPLSLRIPSSIFPASRSALRWCIEEIDALETFAGCYMRLSEITGFRIEYASETIMIPGRNIGNRDNPAIIRFFPQFPPCELHFDTR